MKNLVVAGGTGRTGQAIVKYLTRQADVRVIAVVSRKHAGLQMSSIINDLDYDIPIFPDFATTLSKVKPTIWVDFTEPGIAKEHFRLCIQQDIHPIIGTTGFSEEDCAFFSELCVQHSCGGALIANFSLGAFLVSQAVRFGAKLFPDAAIIDMYPPHKTEIPSGTSKQLLAELKNSKIYMNYDISPYSIRLSGVTAYQEVIFGGIGETVAITHNVSSRTCFGLGVLKAVLNIGNFNRLVTDLADLI